MARNDTLVVPKGDWVEFTNGDVTNITFQNKGSSFVLVLATVGSVKPTSTAGSIRYNPGQGEMNTALTDLFPGVVGANRVWGYAAAPVEAMVSHA